MIRKFIRLICLALPVYLAGDLVYAQAGGGPRDVPVHQAGDFWRLNRTFELVFSLDGSDGTLRFNENYRKTVHVGTPVLTTSNTLGGPWKVYLRNRSNTTVTGSGVLFLPQIINGIDVTVLFRLLSPSTSAGYDWRRVADLAEVRESFSINGTIRARVIAGTAGTTDINIRSLINLDLDMDPPAEVADFPIEVVGEAWIAEPTLGVGGLARLELPSFTLVSDLPASTIEVPFDTTIMTSLAQSYVGDGTRQGFANSYHVAGGLDVWYNATAREYVDFRFPDISIDDGSGGTAGQLRDFRTFIAGTTPGTDYQVGPDANISSVVFTPSRPRHSEVFTISGLAPGAASITATLLETGEIASGPVTAQTFTLGLTAPAQDDASTMTGFTNVDFGSFGIELKVDTGTNPTEVVTMQIYSGVVPPNSSRDWSLYD